GRCKRDNRGSPDGYSCTAAKAKVLAVIQRPRRVFRRWRQHHFARDRPNGSERPCVSSTNHHGDSRGSGSPGATRWFALLSYEREPGTAEQPSERFNVRAPRRPLIQGEMPHDEP